MTSLSGRLLRDVSAIHPDPVPALPSRKSVIAVVPVNVVDDHARAAVSAALSMSASRVVAVHVCDTLEATRTFTRSWERWEPGVPLVLLDRIPSPDDPVAGSLADYLSRRHTAYQVFVVVAERQPSRTDRRQTGPRRQGDALEAALLPLPNVVVCRNRPFTDADHRRDTRV